MKRENVVLLYGLECFKGISTTEKSHISTREKLPYFFTRV